LVRDSNEAPPKFERSRLFFFLRVIARAARYRRLTGVSSCAEEFVMGPDASSLAIVFSFCDLFRFFCSKTFFSAPQQRKMRFQSPGGLNG